MMMVYKQIQTLENYNILLKSGMFWEFHPELTGDWDKDKIIINGVGSLKNPKKENMEELTFGQKAVGLQFNPSGEDNVTKAKQLMADAIDLLEKDATLKNPEHKNLHYFLQHQKNHGGIWGKIS